MKFASVRAVAEDLRQNRIAEHEQFRYFIAGTMLTVLFTAASTFAQAAILDASSLTFLMFYIAVVFLGTTAAFKVNAAGDNQSFLVRYICLSLPMTIRVILLRGLLYFVYLLSLGIAYEHKAGFSTQRSILIVNSMLEVAISIYFYMLMIRYLRYVSAPNQAL